MSKSTILQTNIVIKIFHPVSISTRDDEDVDSTSLLPPTSFRSVSTHAIHGILFIEDLNRALLLYLFYCERRSNAKEVFLPLLNILREIHIAVNSFSCLL